MKEINRVKQLYDTYYSQIISNVEKVRDELPTFDGTVTFEQMVNVVNYGDIVKLCGDNQPILTEIVCRLYYSRNILWGKTVVELGAVQDAMALTIGKTASGFAEKVSEADLNTHIKLTASTIFTACLILLIEVGFLPKDFDTDRFAIKPKVLHGR